MNPDPNDDQADSLSDVEVPELRFVPAEPANLQQIFAVFSEMSAMNPDPNDDQADDLSDDESGGEELPFELRAPRSGAGVWSADTNDDAMEDADEGEDVGDIAMD